MADFLILDDEKNSQNDNNVQNEVSTASSGTFMDRINDFIMSMQSVKTKEKVIFYRLLSTMTNA
ncbi:hypothetical protein HOF65_04100 [bacterium]|jgi:hypothetical protein|nr:hypothetical protein [bacterium]MBT6779078.1 hypothetical protein [bacterium]